MTANLGNTPRPSRRQLLKGFAGFAVAGAGAEIARRHPLDRTPFIQRGLPAPVVDTEAVTSGLREVDFIVIGSGGGGGPVAANLANAGYQVLVLEAGGFIDDATYRVPALSLDASSDPNMSWDFSVRHFTERDRHGRRFMENRDGMLYPRAASLGGCTAHHAMLMLQPDPSDWNDLARITGDPSFNHTEMQRHYHSVLDWLPLETASPELLLNDPKATRIIGAAALQAGADRRAPEFDFNQFNIAGAGLDPNDPALVESGALGFFQIPQSTKNGERRGTRELLLDTMGRHPRELLLQTHAFVERLIIDTGGDGPVATGVEVVCQPHLYGADPLQEASTNSSRSLHRHRVTARREVIVAGGAFNSPQLLMLSGIGPREHLGSVGIETTVNLEGVGTNLQDRYEVSVVTDYPTDFNSAADCTFGKPGDPCLDDWRTGEPLTPYTTNGILGGIKMRSATSERPDLFVFASPSRFEGYQPGFADLATSDHNYFTWAVLKGYSANRTGTVRLRSDDPTETPFINFRYFNDGAPNDGAQADLDALREGVELARRINATADSSALADGEQGTEIFPGVDVASNDELDRFAEREAWGHHASCSNPMGRPHDDKAVVDPNFKVNGVNGLRIVDASVFPRIPGLFIVLPLYILAEKASETILAEHRGIPSAQVEADK